jgi:Spy/CpxP family protein refolding chaperone
MIIPKLGLMMLLTGAAGLAQQPPQPPQPQQQPVVQPARQIPVTDAERRRFEEIKARRDRGDPIPPEDQRFAQEVMARMNQVQRLPATAQPAAPARPPLERALGMPQGMWWARPEAVQRLGLTADQTKKMDEIFLQFRLKSIDLNAAMQKEEVMMEPLISAEQPDEAKIVAQIDRLAQARAELEKANVRMQLGIRRVLTPEQWNKLKSKPPGTP